ncbi:MAG TPA: choice-of-anchor Q domain-containing protein [Aggregatilineales bacterium]|nr:choice-of-anchor Q domain-containing protein [Aggregatilineales bacterium]
MKRFFIFLVVLISSTLVFIPHSYAANFIVNDAASLIAAITAANSNGQPDVISFDADIALTVANDFTEGVNGLPSILADGGNSVTFEGNGFTLSRSGAAAFRIMHISPGATVFINDLTIENGLASAGGLGVMGGAIFTWGQLTIDNSVFSGNAAANVGGLGGAIANVETSSTLTIRNSSFTANAALNNSGGAVHNTRGNVLLIGNTFSNNSADNGGAFASEDGNVTLINNTFSGNAASNQGGAIYTGFNAVVLMQNNTITNNTAGTQGGGIYNIFAGIVTLHNTIVAGNNAVTGSQCFNDTTLGGTVINANSYNVLGSGGSAGGCPAGATDIVPAGAIGTILSPLANNNGPTLTHALVTGSPALDAASQPNCPSDDQRGFLRGFNAVGAVNNPQVGDCDIGAFEFSLDPAYDSNPAVGTTLNLGSTVVGTETSTILEIIEAGSAALTVSLDSISGANAADFRIIGLPTAIGDGNPPQEVAIICTPSAAGLRTAQITFDTNDPNQTSVSYDLECTGTDSLVASASILDINQIVTEGNTTVTATVQLDVPTGFSATGDVTVEIVDAATGNATSGTDYAAIPPTTLTFAGPLTAGSFTQSVTVNILDDPNLEGAEALALMINQVTGAAAIGFPDTHTIIINDNDGGDFTQASFGTNSAIVNETAGTLSIDVQLFIPIGYNLTGDVTVTISDALSGNATSGTDYVAFAPVTLTFVDAPFVVGTTYTQTVTLAIPDDTLLEGAETVELAITGLTGPVEATSPAAFTAIINDDDIGTVLPPVPGQDTTHTVTVNGDDTDFILKTVDNPFATVRQTVVYTIRARNPKTIPLTQVVIYDVFDARLTDIRLISTTHGAGTFNGNTLTVSGFSLQPNEEAVILVSAKIAALRVGETIPNAAILESPNASVHVSNLALVGAQADDSSGGSSQVFVIPSELPSTGETPLWRNWILLAGGALLLLGAGVWFLGQRGAKKV